MINYLKQYKDHLTFYLLYLYIIGFAYYIFYFESFGIKIFTYLTLSEVLLSSISFCVSILLFFLFTEFLIAVVSCCIIAFFSKLKFVNVSIAISVIIILGTVLFGEELFNGLNYIGASMLVVQLLIKLLLISYTRASGYKHKDKAILILSITLIMVTIILFGVFGYSDYRGVVRGENNYTNIKVETSDTIYSTINNDSLYYIGETQSALFLYEMNENNTIIINRGDVKKITVINKAFSKKQEDDIHKETQEKVDGWFKHKRKME